MSKSLLLHNISTLPVKIFGEIQDSEDYTLLKMKSYYASKEDLYKCWCEINDAVTEIIGVNEIYLLYLQSKVAALQHNNNAINGGDEYEKNLARYQEHEAQMYLEMLGGSRGMTETLLSLGRYQGYRLDPEKTTVKEYFTLIKSSNDENKK